MPSQCCRPQADTEHSFVGKPLSLWGLVLSPVEPRAHLLEESLVVLSAGAQGSLQRLLRLRHGNEDHVRRGHLVSEAPKANEFQQHW